MLRWRLCPARYVAGCLGPGAETSFLLLGLLILCSVAGCGRPPQPAPSSAPESSAPLPASEPLVVAEGTDITSTLDQLSLELRKYVARTKTAPKSFEEFASAAHVQAPAPPGGKKYVLEKGNVTLANR